MTGAGKRMRQDIALRAGQAESTDGPAAGGAWAGRHEFSTASLGFKGRSAIASGDGLAAALESEPRMPHAPDGAVAGQAPPPGGRADRPTPSIEEAGMTASALQMGTGPWVDATALICPGCFEPVAEEPPLGWTARAGRRPDFSHSDGSVLCPDSRGAIGEPVEASAQRFWLTDQGSDVLDRSAGGRS